MDSWKPVVVGGLLVAAAMFAKELWWPEERSSSWAEYQALEMTARYAQDQLDAGDLEEAALAARVLHDGGRAATWAGHSLAVSGGYTHMSQASSLLRRIALREPCLAPERLRAPADPSTAPARELLRTTRYSYRQMMSAASLWSWAQEIGQQAWEVAFGSRFQDELDQRYALAQAEFRGLEESLDQARQRCEAPRSRPHVHGRPPRRP